MVLFVECVKVGGSPAGIRRPTQFHHSGKIGGRLYLKRSLHQATRRILMRSPWGNCAGLARYIQSSDRPNSSQSLFATTRVIFRSPPSYCDQRFGLQSICLHSSAEVSSNASRVIFRRAASDLRDSAILSFETTNGRLSTADA